MNLLYGVALIVLETFGLWRPPQIFLKVDLLSIENDTEKTEKIFSFHDDYHFEKQFFADANLLNWGYEQLNILIIVSIVSFLLSFVLQILFSEGANEICPLQ